MNNFESRVLQVVEPYLDEIRTLFDDVPSGDTSGMQECCHKVLAAINDTNREVRNLNKVVTRSGSKSKEEDDDSEDDTKQPVDTAKRIVNWLFSPSVSDDDRHFILDQLFDTGDDDAGAVPITPDAVGERISDLVRTVAPLGTLASNIVQNFQVGAMGKQLDQLRKQMAGNSNHLTNVTNIRATELKQSLNDLKNAFEECCSGMQSKFETLRDDIIVSNNRRLP